MRTVALVSVSFYLSLSMLPAQQPAPIPPGWILVDDMYLPESAIRGDSGFVPSYWPFGLVPFAFSGNVTSTNQTRALEAMAELEAVTGVDFFPRTNQTDYVLIMNSTVNNSLVGVAGGAQALNLVSWDSKYIIVHELMHALGFIHEQSRPDRDAYVTINAANVSTTACTGSDCGTVGSNTCICNFDIVNSATAVGPYDFRSVMHYRRAAFSTNGNDTITCNAGYTQFQTVIGNREYISLGDAQGLQTRYGAALPPSSTSVSPNSAVAGTGGFPTITVTGQRLCGGTTDPNGVPGTVIRWNGIDLTTWQASPTQVSAIVPTAFLSSPGTAQITVFNGAPGGGLGSGAQTFTITCPAGAPLALSPSSPQILAAACAPISIPPVPLSNFDWHVIGVSSPSDWRLSMGSYSSNNAGDTCEFLAGDAAVSPGQSVNPVSGTVSRVSGSDDATVEYATSEAVTINAPYITYMPAGSIVRAFKFFIGSGTRQLHVTGPGSLRWWLVSPTATFTWRGPSNAVASGVVGGAPVTISNGSWCLVVGRSGGASAGYEGFTVNVCSSSPPPFVLPAGFLQYLGGPCHTFQFTPQANRWNVVGVSSASDWDIGVGPAASEYGGSNCDYVVANGQQGAVSPGVGILTRYSGSAQGTAMFPITVAAAFPGGTGNASTYLMAVFEFEVTSPGIFDLTVSGGPGYFWDLHRPGTGSQWRRRGDADFSGFAADGTPATGLALGIGWHAAVVYHNGGPGALASLAFTSALAPYQAPVLTALAPASVPAGSATFALSLYGSEFDPASGVFWDGAPLPTAFVTSTELSATVDASLLLAPGTFQIHVETPSPIGTLQSSALPFAVDLVPPVLTALAPASVPAGSATFTLSLYGSDFDAASGAFWEGAPLPTTFVSATELSATVDASLLLAPGTFQVHVETPTAIGTLQTGALGFNVDNGIPVVNVLTPPQASAGESQITMTIDGSGFVAGCEARLNGAPLPTIFVSETQVLADISAALMVQQLTAQITVFNPAPGGGESYWQWFNVFAPALYAVTPDTIPVQVPGAATINLSLSGNYFLPVSVVYADGVPLPTTFVYSQLIEAVFDPALFPLSAFEGGLEISVQNTIPAASPSVALRIGSGANLGTIGFRPLAPQANDPFSLRIEGGQPYHPLTMIVDLGYPVPLPLWPDPAVNLVLGVTELAGSAGPWVPLLDGIGVFGPSDGAAFDTFGIFAAPGFVMPPAPVGITVVLQALHLDPAATLGFTLTWARSAPL